MQPNHKQDEIIVRAAHGRKKPILHPPLYPLPSRDCVAMSLRRSEATEAISDVFEKIEIATLPSVAPKKQPSRFPSLDGRGSRGGWMISRPPHPCPLPPGEREFLPSITPCLPGVRDSQWLEPIMTPSPRAGCLEYCFVETDRARVMPRNENCKSLILMDNIFQATPNSDIHVAWKRFFNKFIRVFSG